MSRMVTAPCEMCGESFTAPVWRRQRFCSPSCSFSGRRNPRYNGGLSFDAHSGRWKIVCRDGSQMWFYRGVMAAQLGRLLRPDELVHHLNGDPADDRPENLALTTRAAHINLHRADLEAGRL